MADFKHGSVKVSNDIIDQLVAESALQVDGVNAVLGYRNGKLEKKNKDALVAVVVDNTMEVALSILVKKDVNVYQVAEKVQKNVKEQINTILGFDVLEVNVFVKHIS